MNSLPLPLYRIPLAASLVLLLAGSLHAEKSAPGPLAPVLQPVIDDHIIQGMVVLVADKDKVLDLEAVGESSITTHAPMRTDSLFWIASMTKSMTATALMMLVDEGKVSINDPVEKYLPEFKGQRVVGTDGKTPDHAPAHPITIKEVLSHTSGLVLAGDVKMPPGVPLTLKDQVAKCASLPLRQEPGTKYEYNNSGINTAGRIIEVLSGMSYAEFMQKRLFEPLGMKDTTFWPTVEQGKRLVSTVKPTDDKKGLEDIKFDTTITPALIARLAPGMDIPREMLANFGTSPLGDYAAHYAMPAGGLYSTATDVGRFCQMLLNGGTWQGKTYLSPAALSQMTTIKTEGIMRSPDEGYGLGLSITLKDTEGHSVGSFGHRGARRTAMWVDPKNGLAMVILVSHMNMPGEDQKRMYSSFMKTAVEKFGKKN